VNALGLLSRSCKRDLNEADDHRRCDERPPNSTVALKG